MSLSGLIRERVSKALATATSAIPATEEASPAETVATIATIAVATSADSIAESIRQADWAELTAAIGACCDARGESAEQRDALVADCHALPPEEWQWHITYFQDEAERWRTANAHGAHR
jgi:hypothetical protein